MAGPRARVAALTISIAAGLGWIAAEGFSSAPYVPVKGDRPTIGYGSTFHADGTPVKMTDGPITKEQARALALGELEKTYAECVRKSLPSAKMLQGEFDLAADFTGQYGCTAWNNSPMRRDYAAANYAQACEGYLDYRFMTSLKPIAGFEPYAHDKTGRAIKWRFNCATPGNKVCRGVWTRSVDRATKCAALQ